MSTTHKPPPLPVPTPSIDDHTSDVLGSRLAALRLMTGRGQAVPKACYKIPIPTVTRQLITTAWSLGRWLPPNTDARWPVLIDIACCELWLKLPGKVPVWYIVTVAWSAGLLTSKLGGSGWCIPLELNQWIYTCTSDNHARWGSWKILSDDSWCSVI